MKIRLYADFNNRDAKDRVRLNTVGSEEDIAKFLTSLVDGIELILYDDELDVEARLMREDTSGIWLGLPNWSTVKHRSAS
jgi:hypothetical protein